ncbi:MAG: cytochrome c oxidase subunit II [Myxococcales bacterium]|nr:cytochrome c oxidase subunit II [Myxococcales bacterium]
MNTEPTIQLPGQWSTFAPDVDWVYYFIYWLSVVLFVAITGAAIYFVMKYRRQPGVKAEPSGHNTILEVTWTVTPLILLVVLFHWGFKGYVQLTNPPSDAMDIRVRAQKWSWDFEYPNGGHTVNQLHVPVNRPVRLVMSSSDVIHSMFIPAFRVKRDAVPGYYSTLWFEATHVGQTDFFCTEYCGAAETGAEVNNGRGHFNWAGHFSMIGSVTVHRGAEWPEFLDGILRAPSINGVEATPAQWGEILYRERQCFTCHSVNGSPMTGPTWQHMFGHNVDLQDGSSAMADENYLRRSILQPNAQVVRGFQPVMPTYAGQLNDRQIDALIAYMRTLQ